MGKGSAVRSVGGEEYDVPVNGAHVSSHSWNIVLPDEVTIQFDRFHNSNLKEEEKYYFRYITEVNDKDESCREFEKFIIDIDGTDTWVIDTRVDGHQLVVYNYSYHDKRYLIIEYGKAVKAEEMRDIGFSTLVALGMITTTIHLNECWLIAYENEGKKEETGLFYQSLVPTVNCQYRIFSNKVYPSLVHVAQTIDPVNGEHRALSIISSLKLSTALPDFSRIVFGRLIENLLKYEELQRGIFIILMGAGFNLEIQAAIYCVALEAISNLAELIIGKQKASIIDRKISWKTVRKRFLALADDLCHQSVITEIEKGDIVKKIDSMNRAFNSEKLRALLEYYRYPIKQFDDLTLFLRNLLLHGSIQFKKIPGRKPEDYLFELSMNLHKLCCSIALLMSGYKGYIVNNRKMYGYANSYKAFIRIGNNTKSDYPTYKEPKSFWIRTWVKVKSFFGNG